MNMMRLEETHRQGNEEGKIPQLFPVFHIYIYISVRIGEGQKAPFLFCVVLNNTGRKAWIVIFF